MGRISLFSSLGAIIFAAGGFFGATYSGKNSFLTDIFLVVIALGPLLMINSVVLGIISIIKDKQRGFGAAGLITGLFFSGMFILFIYLALKGLAGFR